MQEFDIKDDAYIFKKYLKKVKMPWKSIKGGKYRALTGKDHLITN